ncbi:MAG: clostripain-related cysteine peptidase [Prevotella sp.]|nr:clostripain-related cysteine peptidase [Prevotella sp.]MCM1075298.1 clostripain-related cysteine peptidase [Ruminococcus sp.]
MQNNSQKDTTRGDENVTRQREESGQSSSIKPAVNSNRFSTIIIPLLTWLFRLSIGGTFIFSGVVKAIDPWGTIFKFHDYLTALPGDSFNWLLPILTPAAFVLFTVELLIGVAVITGSYRRIAACGALLMMLIMTPLTLWIALKNPVAECGCFGDALILSNWQTFWKNIVLLAMSGWLIIYNKRARYLILPAIQWIMVIAVIAFSVIVGFIGYSIQPMIDFRPYPVGSTLIESYENNTDSEGNLMAVWKKGDQQITIPADSIPEGDDWEFVKRVEDDTIDEDAIQNEGKQKGLAIFDGSDDVTEEIIPTQGEAVVVFMYDLPNLSKGNYYKLNSLDAYCRGHDVTFIVVAAATPLQIQDFAHQSMADYPIYSGEDTAMKEVARGNPSFIYLKDGKIVYKAVFSAIPSYDFKQDTPSTPGALAAYEPDMANPKVFKTLCLIAVSFIVLLIFLSHMPMVVSFTARKIKSRWVKDGNMAKTMLIIGCCASMLTACSDNDPNPDPIVYPEHDERTILIYMVASNTLSSNSQDDIDEILKGYEKYEEDINTNILVYRINKNMEAPTLSIVDEDRNGRPIMRELKTYSETSSSLSKYRVGEVIYDMRQYAPAAEYGLFLWSHASAWLPDGVPVTAAPPMYSFGDDWSKTIKINDLAEAIPQNLFSFIWFDCCLMSNIETLYQFRNHCPTIIAYPTQVLAPGAPYDLIMPYIATPAFNLKMAAQTTWDYYANNQDWNMRYCTVAVIDTSVLQSLAEVCRNIVKLGYKLQSTAGLQTYGKLRGTTFYDFVQVYSSLAGPETALTDLLTQRADKATILKLATPKFLNIFISQDHFSGISCHIPGMSNNSEYEDYYKTLDWYKAVYK